MIPAWVEQHNGAAVSRDLAPIVADLWQRGVTCVEMGMLRTRKGGSFRLRVTIEGTRADAQRELDRLMSAIHAQGYHDAFGSVFDNAQRKAMELEPREQMIAVLLMVDAAA